MDIDGTFEDIGRVFPELVNDVGTREKGALVGGEQEKDVEFFSGKVELLTGERYGTVVWVDDDVCIEVDGGVVGGDCSSEDGIDAGEDFVDDTIFYTFI